MPIDVLQMSSSFPAAYAALPLTYSRVLVCSAVRLRFRNADVYDDGFGPRGQNATASHRISFSSSFDARDWIWMRDERLGSA